jgi:pimeloyl-ACP methyl ester carboxylesterase
VITHPDGTRSYIVDIPGTKVWDLPGANPDLADFGTNLHAIGNDSTAREAAVADALRRAGAGPHDPVMLVGHSQGGAIAAQAAQDSAKGSFGFNVTHVVTAGAPIGRIDIPPQVQVLSIENVHDIVPHLDGAENPDRPNLTTVKFDVQTGTIGGDHGLATYASTGRSLDHSSDPSVTAFRNSAGDFLSTGDNGNSVTTNVYTYARG